MWRRALYAHLRTVASAATASSCPSLPRGSELVAATAAANRASPFFVARHFSVDAGNVVSKKKVEDVMPIATGHEREELEAELEGRDILAINHPVGPFGTKEAPAVVQSYYDKRIVGCPGGEGEDEHDVVWFWLEKGKPHECPVCSQYFVLEVVGPGGPPDGHGHGEEDEEHH